MARFMILIHGNESRWESMPPNEIEQIENAHRAFRARVGESVLCSGQLDASRRAVTLRAPHGGTPVLTEGPYTESSEVLGGFYVVEAPDRDHAVSYADGLAEVRHDHSWVEVWPLVDATEAD